jgi:hypothetical protein
MRIVATDGKDGFKTVEECVAYEKQIEEEKMRAIKAEKELKEKLNSDLEEIENLRKEIIKKTKEFESKYDTRIYIPPYGNRYSAFWQMM